MGKLKTSVRTACLVSAGLWLSGYAWAELPADFQAKADKGVALLSSLAADPTVVAVAKAGSGMAAGMTNGKWSDVAESDAGVVAMSSSAVSAKLASAQTGEMGKLILRDKDANLVAYAKGTEKPFLYNIANRPNFKKSIAGQVFIGEKVAPDPTSQKPSVQIAVPVKDGDAVVGILHAAVN